MVQVLYKKNILKLLNYPIITYLEPMSHYCINYYFVTLHVKHYLRN